MDGRVASTLISSFVLLLSQDTEMEEVDPQIARNSSREHTYVEIGTNALPNCQDNSAPPSSDVESPQMAEGSDSMGSRGPGMDTNVSGHTYASLADDRESACPGEGPLDVSGNKSQQPTSCYPTPIYDCATVTRSHSSSVQSHVYESLECPNVGHHQSSQDIQQRSTSDLAIYDHASVTGSHQYSSSAQSQECDNSEDPPDVNCNERSKNSQEPSSIYHTPLYDFSTATSSHQNSGQEDYSSIETPSATQDAQNNVQQSGDTTVENMYSETENDNVYATVKSDTPSSLSLNYETISSENLNSPPRKDEHERPCLDSPGASNTCTDLSRNVCPSSSAALDTDTENEHGTMSSGYLNPITTAGYMNTVVKDGYLNPLAKDGGYLNPITTAGYMNSVVKDCGYLNPLAKDGGYLNPIAKDGGYLSPIAKDGGYLNAENPPARNKPFEKDKQDPNKFCFWQQPSEKQSSFVTSEGVWSPVLKQSRWHFWQIEWKHRNCQQQRLSQANQILIRNFFWIRPMAQTQSVGLLYMCFLHSAHVWIL